MPTPHREPISALLHFYLCHLAEGMGYDVGSSNNVWGFIDGICGGASFMFELAALVGDIEQFDDRLKFLWTLIVEKTKSPAKGMSDDERINIIQSIADKPDIRAFFDSFCFAYSPDSAKLEEPILKGIRQSDIELIAPIIASSKLEALGGLKVRESLCFAADFDHPTDLYNICKKLTRAIWKSEVSVVCRFGLNNHAVSLSFNAQEKSWSYFDINSPPSRTIRSQELSAMLKESMLAINAATNVVIGKISIMSTVKAIVSGETQEITDSKINRLQKLLFKIKMDWYSRTTAHSTRLLELTTGKTTLMHFAVAVEDMLLIQVLATCYPWTLLVTDQKHRTPLQTLYSNLEKHLNIIIQLIAANPRIINEQGLLHQTVSKDNCDLIELLTNHPNCDPNVKNEYGETPLHHATSVKATELLLKAGAKVNIISSQHKPPLTEHIISQNPSSYHRIQILLAAGAPLFTTEYSEYDPETEECLNPEPLDTEAMSYRKSRGIRSPLLAAEYRAFGQPHENKVLELLLAHLFYPSVDRHEPNLEKKRAVFLDKLEHYAPRLSKRSAEFMLEMLIQKTDQFDFVHAPTSAPL